MKEYESINQDNHELSQFDDMSRTDLISLVQTLTIQLKIVEAQRNMYESEQPEKIQPYDF